MTSTEEEFDLAPKIDEPMNSFIVVHVYNRSEVYHLTRQVLLDSTLTQSTNQIFYHILTKNSDEFNVIYGSFACLIERNNYESDLYLNVDSEALEHIIKYVQTSKLEGELIYAKNWRTINEIIDLATMFGMPVLVSSMRLLHPNDEKINIELQLLTETAGCLLQLYKYYVNESFDINEGYIVVDKFIRENKKEIIDNYIKPNMHNKPFINKFLILLLYLFISPLLQNKNNNSINMSMQSINEQYINQINDKLIMENVINMINEKLKKSNQNIGSTNDRFCNETHKNNCDEENNSCEKNIYENIYENNYDEEHP